MLREICTVGQNNLGGNQACLEQNASCCGDCKLLEGVDNPVSLGTAKVPKLSLRTSLNEKELAMDSSSELGLVDLSDTLGEGSGVSSVVKRLMLGEDSQSRVGPSLQVGELVR
eukprot:2924953-Ditylum_brightwellii.AAC.1